MEIWENWKKVDGEEIEDLESYISNQFELRKFSEKTTEHDVTIIIGTDSMVKRKHKEKVVSFLTVIIFKKGTNGCHVITRRDEEKVKGYVPTSIKLNGEVHRTSALAFWMRDNINIDPEVHFDLNNKEEHASYEVYKYIKGYLEGCQFNVLYKPSSYAASSAADYFL